MTFNEFQQGTQRTWRHDQPDVSGELVNAIFGLVGESGEMVDNIKKDLFHGIPMDKDALKKELGDIEYYLSVVENYYGFTKEDVCRTNQDKLRKRYPDGFALGGGIRD